MGNYITAQDNRAQQPGPNLWAPITRYHVSLWLLTDVSSIYCLHRHRKRQTLSAVSPSFLSLPVCKWDVSLSLFRSVSLQSLTLIETSHLSRFAKLQRTCDSFVWENNVQRPWKSNSVRLFARRAASERSGNELLPATVREIETFQWLRHHFALRAMLFLSTNLSERRRYHTCYRSSKIICHINLSGYVSRERTVSEHQHQVWWQCC